MLNAFKIKPFDLQPILEQWKDGPTFNGNPKKDLPVEEWLDKVKEGCVQRGVPEECWYKVAQHFMGPKARARLDEVKEVVRKVHGGKYCWTWKKFRIAILNMGWDIDRSETKTIKISGKSLGLWFMRKKDGSEANLTEEPESEPVKKSSRPNVRPKSSERPGSARCSRSTKNDTPPSTRPPVKRSATVSPNQVTRRPGPPAKARSEFVVATRKASTPPPSTRSETTQVIEIHSPETSSDDNGEVMKTAQAPLWLLNACNALDFITGEHPKTMSALSAILITVGSIPAIPAISAGAGGAILASGAAHAIGAIAVGVGQALAMSVKNQQNQNSSNSITEK